MKENKGKLSVSKLAVFDLDGTLYKCNSHIEILNQYYGINAFDCWLAKAIGKMFTNIYMVILNYFYKKIPLSQIDCFNPEFRPSALALLETKRQKGYEVVIVSNAPTELVQRAATRLNVSWLRAEINQKDKVVIHEYNYGKLFVCTDNLSDINILDMAHERVIYVTKKTRRLFNSKYPNATIMEV